MDIRFAKERDIKDIIKLCALHAAFEGAAFNISNKEELLSKYLFSGSDVLKCLVVEEGSQIVGYATFMKQFSTWDAQFYIYLDCLFFKKEMRGKGLGTKLMNKIKSHAKTENCHSIQWQTPNFNIKAIQFYQKIGAMSKTKERFLWCI
ncbi:GNAT family N-acetyltransferase [Mariniflexile sp. AS56]|uniref:GNAT family N-acetyltransferase n=1 Tax=Mariniflexile sp. AS56 TaxID=3063957 RepID=UPI0026EB4AAB|nr:GNAT family N-acetyltransferase [Mariniflexile sp. AS56]MDO7173716.1 GNAT family N-acetyltransferase [Mariniflexile sp. AS56]